MPEELIHFANGISSGQFEEGNFTENSTAATISSFAWNTTETYGFVVETSKYILSGDKARLSIPRAKDDSGGRYGCIVTNRAGQVKKNFDVHILGECLRLKNFVIFLINSKMAIIPYFNHL